MRSKMNLNIEPHRLHPRGFLIPTNLGSLIDWNNLQYNTRDS